MIRPLRRRHGRVTFVLALVVPAMFAWALTHRAKEPKQLSDPDSHAQIAFEVSGWSGEGMQGTVFLQQDMAFLMLDGAIRSVADPYVYLCEQMPTSDQLTQDARLLGSWWLRKPLHLKPKADLYVVVYSAAHHRMVQYGQLTKVGP